MEDTFTTTVRSLPSSHGNMLRAVREILRGRESAAVPIGALAARSKLQPSHVRPILRILHECLLIDLEEPHGAVTVQVGLDWYAIEMHAGMVAGDTAGSEPLEFTEGSRLSG